MDPPPEWGRAWPPGVNSPGSSCMAKIIWWTFHCRRSSIPSSSNKFMTLGAAPRLRMPSGRPHGAGQGTPRRRCEAPSRSSPRRHPGQAIAGWPSGHFPVQQRGDYATGGLSKLCGNYAMIYNIMRHFSAQTEAFFSDMYFFQEPKN